MSKTQDERLFDAIKQGVMELINSYRPHEDDEYQTTLERYFWNYVESNAGDIAEMIIEEDFDAYEVYLNETEMIAVREQINKQAIRLLLSSEKD